MFGLGESFVWAVRSTIQQSSDRNATQMVHRRVGRTYVKTTCRYSKIAARAMVPLLILAAGTGAAGTHADGVAFTPTTSPAFQVDYPAPTADKPQSKLWFMDGCWWALLPRATGPSLWQRTETGWLARFPQLRPYRASFTGIFAFLGGFSPLHFRSTLVCWGGVTPVSRGEWPGAARGG